MVGLRGVSGGRADTIIFDLEQVFVFKRFRLGVTPQLHTDVAMQLLSVSFDQTVTNSLYKNTGEIIVVSLIFASKLINTMTSNGHATNVILEARRGNKISLAKHVCRLALCLLTEHAELTTFGAAALIFIDDNILAVCTTVGSKDTICAFEPQTLVSHNFLQHLLSLIKELLGFSTNIGIIEDLRVAAVRIPATQLKGVKERTPVDVRYYILDRAIWCLLRPKSHMWLRCRRNSFKVNVETLFLSHRQGVELALL
mmetsp:Transcript_3358/g.7515  ORF Transcript_3358/g.7515 Transcript_3358/m.7515 type:complete len:255 (+) Transcript_3358:312-1076(+)